MGTGPKILTLDIETSPLLVYTWGTRDQNIGLDMIVEDWEVLASAWKWLGNPVTMYFDRREDRLTEEDILCVLWDVLDAADIVVAHNGDRFDIKKIRSRMLDYGMTPFSPVRTIDTLKASRQIGSWTSHKLEYLTNRLTKTKKSKHSQFPGFSLWRECLAGNLKAWAEMEKYNKLDVVSTEELYLVLRPWMDNHPNVSTYISVDDAESVPRCTRCGSDKLQRRGYRTIQAGVYPRYHCQSCRGYCRGRLLIPTLDRTNLLVN